MSGGLSTAVLATATTDGDVAEGATFGPVAAAGFTEVSGLGQAVVVVVAEFGVGRSTTWAIRSQLDDGFP